MPSAFEDAVLGSVEGPSPKAGRATAPRSGSERRSLTDALCVAIVNHDFPTLDLPSEGVSGALLKFPTVGSFQTAAPGVTSTAADSSNAPASIGDAKLLAATAAFCDTCGVGADPVETSERESGMAE